MNVCTRACTYGGGSRGGAVLRERPGAASYLGLRKPSIRGVSPHVASHSTDLVRLQGKCMQRFGRHCRQGMIGMPDMHAPCNEPHPAHGQRTAAVQAAEPSKCNQQTTSFKIVHLILIFNTHSPSYLYFISQAKRTDGRRSV